MKVFAWRSGDHKPHPTLQLQRAYVSEDGQYTIWQGRPVDPNCYVYRLQFPDGGSEDFARLKDAKRRGRDHSAGLE